MATLNRASQVNNSELTPMYTTTATIALPANAVSRFRTTMLVVTMKHLLLPQSSHANEQSSVADNDVEDLASGSFPEPVLEVRKMSY